MAGHRHDNPDKVEGQKPTDKAENTKQPSADELYKDFQKMIKDSATDLPKVNVQDDHLVLDPVRYEQNQGNVIRDDISNHMVPGNTGIIPPYLEDEMKTRTEHPQGVAELETLNAVEQMKWGKGASDIDPTIYQGDSVQLMDKIDGAHLDANGIKNDLMKCMMTEAVLGKDGDGMKKIEDIAKKLGYDDKEILAMATEARQELEKMGVHTNMSVLNTFIGEHGGAAERSFPKVEVPMDEAPMGEQYNQQKQMEQFKKDVMEKFSQLPPEKQKEVDAGVEAIEKHDEKAVAKFLKSATPEQKEAFYKDLEKKGYKVKHHHVGPILFGGPSTEETEIIPPPGPFGHAEHEIKIRETSNGSLGPKAPPPSVEVDINLLR